MDLASPIHLLRNVSLRQFDHLSLYAHINCSAAVWFWVVKRSCIGILGGLWMASKPKDRLLIITDTADTVPAVWEQQMYSIDTNNAY